MSGRHHEGRRVSDVAGGVGGAEVIAVLDAVLQPGVAKAAFEGGRQLLLDSVVGGPRADHDERYRVRRAEPAHGGGPVARARRDVVEGRRGGVVVDPERLAGRVAGAIATRSGHAHPGALGTAVGERGAAIEPGYRVGSGEPKFDGGVVPAVVIRRPALRGVQVRRRRGVVEQWDVAAGDVAGHVAAGPRNRRGGAVRSAVGDCRAALEPRRGVAAVEDELHRVVVPAVVIWPTGWRGVCHGGWCRVDVDAFYNADRVAVEPLYFAGLRRPGAW